MGENVCDCGTRQPNPNLPPGEVRIGVCLKCAEEDQYSQQMMTSLECCPKCHSSEFYSDSERDGKTCSDCDHHETLDELDERRFKLLAETGG